MSNSPLTIHQANVYYNYTLGFVASEIDLVKTAQKALKLGISSSAYFSDNKFIYLDDEDEIQVEWIQPEGRHWDSHQSVTFDNDLPKDVLEDLVLSLEISFHEDRIAPAGTNQMAPYVRLSLPPIVLENSEIALPLSTSVKIFDDGIAILSFQLDGIWDGADESFFINEVVNLFNKYYESVWVHAEIQQLEADLIIPTAYKDQITLAGKPLKGREINKSIRKMRKEARKTFQESISKDGRTFNIGEKEVLLHKAAGSDDNDTWESNFNFCTSIYRNALSNLIVPHQDQQEFASSQPIHWQGRPSISLMRFDDQPDNKEELLSKFSQALLRILGRSTNIENNSELPKDLRPFGDFTFHGTRAVFLWTWIRPDNSPENVWENPNTLSTVMNQQCRVEHIEYFNMRLARACKLAKFPPSKDHLIESYRILSMSEDDLHNSGSAGEITDAIKTIVNDIGTSNLISPAKEAARWHLDEMRYKAEKNKLKVDRWMTFVFGLVGTTGLSEFLVKPYLEVFLAKDQLLFVPILSFAIASIIVFVSIMVVWFYSRE